MMKEIIEAANRLQMAMVFKGSVVIKTLVISMIFLIQPGI